MYKLDNGWDGSGRSHQSLQECQTTDYHMESSGRQDVVQLWLVVMHRPAIIILVAYRAGRIEAPLANCQPYRSQRARLYFGLNRVSYS